MEMTVSGVADFSRFRIHQLKESITCSDGVIIRLSGRRKRSGTVLRVGSDHCGAGSGLQFGLCFRRIIQVIINQLRKNGIFRFKPVVIDIRQVVTDDIHFLLTGVGAECTNVKRHIHRYFPL